MIDESRLKEIEDGASNFLHFVSHAEVKELVAEVRRLREALQKIADTGVSSRTQDYYDLPDIARQALST